MVSNVLSSRNESSFMGKSPISKSHMNPNPNSKNLSSRRQVEANFSQADSEDEELTSVSQFVPDDASSFNRNSYNPAAKNSRFDQGEYLSFDIASYQTKELIKLKKRWIEELERVRVLENRIEAGEFLQFKPTTNEEKKVLSKKITGNKRALPANPGRELKRFAFSPECIVDLMKMCGQVLRKLMSHKQGYIFNSPVDVVAFGLHDYNHIVKHPMDLGTVKSNLGKNLYKSPLEFASDVRLTFKNAMLYNPTGHEVHELADRLLFRFNDLFRPVYQKCVDEHLIMPQLHQQRAAFDDLQENSMNRKVRKKSNLMDITEKSDRVDLPATSKNLPAVNPRVSRSPEAMPLPVPEKFKKSSLMDMTKKLKQVDVPATSQNMLSLNPRPSQSPEEMPSPRRAPSPRRVPSPKTVSSPKSAPSPRRVAPPVKPSGKIYKQPKPKAKDPNKREMTLEEKHKLGAGLQSLPDEKMTQVVQIIKKRNKHLTEDCDEIELDIEAVDTETLWELDRFVTYWKKFVSKMKRQALMGNSAATIDGYAVAESNVAPVRKGKRVEGGGEEDVDIGDDIPTGSFPPVEIEKDDGPGRANSSSSSSSDSSSDSSSSSDSGSGSSSGSDSNADDNAQSKDFSRV